MHLRIRSLVRTKLVAALAVTSIAAALVGVSSSPASAATTTCKVVQVSKSSITYSPHMSVPICYNGSQVWINGGITPGVQLVGWFFDGFSWYGSYNDSSKNWLGVGENFTMTEELPPFVTISCQPRWYLNPSGQVYDSSYGC